MLEVYNQLIASYYSNYKSNMTLNKNERSIYKNIQSVNKKSPLYKLNMTDEKQEFTLNIKDSALNIKGLLDYITEPENNVFSTYKIISNDTNTASVKVLNNDSESMPEQISIKVKQMAAPQINTSYEVPAPAVSNLTGAYTFSIDSEDTLYEYKFNITPGSTNESILTKLSDFINKSKIGIKSEVVYSKDTVKLNLVSEATGSTGAQLFSIKDSGKASDEDIGIVSYYGLNNIAQQSMNSLIEINGEPKETLRNHFTFNKTLNVTLHNTNEEPVLIQAVTDVKPIHDVMKQMLDTFNTMVDLASSNKHNIRSSKLVHDLNQAVIRNYDELQEAGITSLPDNHLVVDDKQLNASIQNSSLKKIFSKDSAFYNDLKSAAYNISMNPVHYLDKVVVSYPNTSVPGFLNPYAASMYSGMLFNSYC